MGHVAKGSEARRSRQASATERKDRWDKMSRQQKILSLIERGHGHCQQAVRLKLHAPFHWTKEQVEDE